MIDVYGNFCYPVDNSGYASTFFIGSFEFIDDVYVVGCVMHDGEF